MKNCGYKSGFTPLETTATRISLRGKRDFLTGFTLIEMMLVIAVILILVSMIIGAAKYLDDQAKVRLTKNTIALVGNALEQFRDFGYQYKGTDYSGLAFPLDCNDLYLTVNPTFYDDIRYPLRSAIDPSIDIVSSVYDPNYSGSAAMYFILSQVPDCRSTLGKIDKSLLTNKGTDKSTDITIKITVNGVDTYYPFTRIIDPWGTPLRYDYYIDYADYIALYPGNTWSQYLTYRNLAKRTFPQITSAGPDRKFGTNDDISNIEQK